MVYERTTEYRKQLSATMKAKYVNDADYRARQWLGANSSLKVEATRKRSLGNTYGAKPFEERFWAKVEVVGSHWIWVAARGTSGYGQAWSSTRKKVIEAHRVSYEYFVAPIPDGMTIDHLCRVKLCVNPGHLEVVSLRENILRGDSPSARQARQECCKNGHLFTEENTIRWRNCRKCRICTNERVRLRKWLSR